MKTLTLSFLTTAMICTSMHVTAQSPFEGTWKLDLSKVTPPKKPDVVLLENGIYECKSCVPPFKGKADGTDQPLSGVPYFDTIAVDVRNAHEVDLTGKKGRTVVWTEHMVVSSDGNTLSSNYSDASNTNGGKAVTGKSLETRVAKGPPDAHLISGSWKPGKIESISDNGSMWSYKVIGDELNMTNPTGQSYTAKLNGPEAPMRGDPGITNVSVKLLGNRTLQEIDKRDGKVVVISTMTISSDNKTAKVKVEDKIQSTSMEFVAIKQ